MPTTEAPAPPDEGIGAAPVRLIRVLCVDYSLGFGGSTKSMALMLRDVPHIEPVILTSQDPDLRRLWYRPWKTHTFRRLINYRARWRLEALMERLRIPRLPRRVASKAFTILDTLDTLANTMRIAWLVKRYRIDVVHLTNGFGPPEALLGARLAGVPSIAHLRGFFRPVPSASSRRGPLPTLVIGDSGAVTDSYLDASWFDVPATTIHEVVDVPRFDATAHRRQEGRVAWSIEGNEIAVGLFGRVMAWKGQKEFVLAMIDAMARNSALVAVLVGDGVDGAATYFDDVKQLIRNSGVADRFRLTGYVEDVEPLYSAMDIVVHASIEPEPCGMVIMEAMAAKRPVIAADAGGPRELVRDGVDGHLVAPGDVAVLAAAILSLADSPDTRRAMGEAGYARAHELFDVPVAAARVRTVYEHLVAGRSGTRAAAPTDWYWPDGTT